MVYDFFNMLLDSGHPFKNFIYLFKVVLGLHCCKQGLLSSCSAQASHHTGFSCFGAHTLRHTGFSS